MDIPALPNDIKSLLCAEMQAEIVKAHPKKGEQGFKKKYSCVTHPTNSFIVNDMGGLPTMVFIDDDTYILAPLKDKEHRGEFEWVLAAQAPEEQERPE